MLQSPFYGVFRSSHWRFSIIKSVFKNFAKFTWKHLCHSLFFNKVLWILQKFQEYLLYRTLPGNYFCIFHVWFTHCVPSRYYVSNQNIFETYLIRIGKITKSSTEGIILIAKVIWLQNRLRTDYTFNTGVIYHRTYQTQWQWYRVRTFSNRKKCSLLKFNIGTLKQNMGC